MKKSSQTGFLIIILMIIVFPGVQKTWQPISSRGLKGYFTHHDAPEFTWKDWFTGTFQFQSRDYMEDSIGFKNDLVRIFNQIDFSLFGISHAFGILVGKERYLFFEEGIRNYTGRFVLSKTEIHQRVKKLKTVQEFLWKQHHILLLVVIAPDKAHFYPEYIPERYLRKPATRTNYQSYLEEMDNEEVDYVDFNSYFLTMKDKSEYPLFPKNGSHWSDYGAIRAFDSLVSVLEIRMEMNLPDRIRDSIFLTSQTLHDDNDMIRTSNLIWEPGHPDMALELFHYRKEAGTRKPKALFVGDSFYWQWYHPGLLDSTFSTRQFWYYDKEILPYRPENPKVRNLDLQEVLFEQNVIILLQTMGGNCKLGYGFVERAYRTFIMGEGRMLFFEELIRNSPKWMEEIKRKAKEWNMAVEKVIEKDAKYMVFMESQKKKDNK